MLSLVLDGFRSCLFEGLDALGNLLPPPFPVGSYILPVFCINFAAPEVGLQSVPEAEKGSSQATLSLLQLTVEQHLWYAALPTEPPGAP